MAGGRSAATFLAVAVLWGVPYAFIKSALEHGADPLLVAWARVAIGAVILLVLAGVRGELRGLPGHWNWLFLVAVSDVAGPFTALTLGERHLSSSLAGVLVACTPLVVAVLLALLGPDERPSRKGWLGLVLGFAGVAALLGLDFSGSLGSAGLVLLAAVGYGIATLIIRMRLSDLPPLAVSAIALTIATVLLAPGAGLAVPWTDSSDAWLAIVMLGILCTAAAFALYYLLIEREGARRAALTTYLAPVFSVLAGAVTLSEAITAGTFVGLVLVLAGCWLAR